LDDAIIPAGEISTLKLYANFSSYSTTTEPAIAMKVNSSGDMSIKDVDNNDVSDFTHSGDVSRTVTLGDTGNLKVNLLTDDAEANDNFYLLAGGAEGSNSDYLGELKFTTKNEWIKVEKLALANQSTAGSDDLLAVSLYDKDGELVAQEGAIDSSGNVEFDLSGYGGLTADNSTSLFIRVEAKSINAEGDDSYQHHFQFGLG
jgi:hypothetical protein